MSDTDKSELENEAIAQGFDDTDMPVSAQLVRELAVRLDDYDVREILLGYHNEPRSNAFVARLEATEKAIQALITQQCNQARIDELESLSKSTTVNGVPYFSGVESSIIIERLDQLTALKDKDTGSA